MRNGLHRFASHPRVPGEPQLEENGADVIAGSVTDRETVDKGLSCGRAVRSCCLRVETW